VALGELADLIERARRPRDDRLVAQKAADVFRHVRGGSVASRFVLFEGLRDDGFDVVRQPVHHAAQPRGLLFAYDARHFGERLAVQIVGRAIGQQFVGDDAKGVDVGSRIDQIGIAGDLLRAHIGNRANHLTGAGVQRRADVGVDGAGQTEVEHLRLTRRVDEDVRRLEIAMDDAFLVGVFDRVADLDEQPQTFRDAQRPLGDVVVERASAHQLHREVRLDAVRRIGDARVVHLRDAGMLKASEKLGLVLEAPQARGIPEPRTNHLQRHAAVGALLFGLVDHAHGAFPDDAQDAVRPDSVRKVAAGLTGQVRVPLDVGVRIGRVFPVARIGHHSSGARGFETRIAGLRSRVSAVPGAAVKRSS
jgi:hypothetical protein